MTASAKSSSTGPVTLRTIIIAFREGEGPSLIAYEKLCKTIDLIEQWNYEQKVEFINQFVDLVDVLDASCKQLVKKLAEIEWHVIPLSTSSSTNHRERFVKFLRDLAIQHICHTETIIYAFIRHFIAKTRLIVPNVDMNDDERGVLNRTRLKTTPKFELVLDEREQDEIYSLSHQSIEFLLRCYPMCSKVVQQGVSHLFPHFSHPLQKYESFMRNTIKLSDYASKIRRDLLSTLLDSLITIDGMVANRQRSMVIDEDEEYFEEGFDVFLMDEEHETMRNVLVEDEDEKVRERIEKLDISLTYLFSYIARAHQIALPPNIEERIEWLPDTCSTNELSSQLCSIFEEKLLMAVNVQHVSFIWFYLCSIQESYMDSMLDSLWRVIMRPGQSPNDWKKSQGAACYMGAFLARTESVGLRKSMEWMERMMKRCRSYLNELCDIRRGHSNDSNNNFMNSVGTLRHGVFYALCEALLLTFCFRYKEIVDARELRTIQEWGFGHLVHCSLKPLTFISPYVAKCFAIISRSLQLVDCNPVLPVYVMQQKHLPFEPFFPFDSYYLCRSSVFIKPLLRRFTPLAEDASVLQRELRWHNAKTLSGAMGFKNTDEAAGSLDFLEDLRRDMTDLVPSGRQSIDEIADIFMESLKSN